MSSLYLIPARGGSKGLPGKNIKPLLGKPLIHYTIDAAVSVAEGDPVCVSSDDQQIIKQVEDYGLAVPFTRPAELSTDTATADEVISHALSYYEGTGHEIDSIVLLQPTSPLRNAQHIREALALYDDSVDMVVSVKETDANPYTVLYEEGMDELIEKSKSGDFTRRQDAPKVYELNGAIYIINAMAFKEYGSLSLMKKVKKYIMDKKHSIDIDELLDFEYCKFLLEGNHVTL